MLDRCDRDKVDIICRAYALDPCSGAIDS